ncbi:MAG: hypothetical protein RIR00_2600, partial [Pseudomonadota bacterium]
IAAGMDEKAACSAAQVPQTSYQRWAERVADEGMGGLADRERSGRPAMIVLDDAEAEALRRAYLRSNMAANSGSMTMAARWLAKDPESCLRPETREAILKERASKHALPVEVRRACRASAAEVARYRDKKAGLNDGIYAPDTMRLSDGVPLAPGQRQVWDDASVNVGVVVPWQRGGDACSDRWGVRVARFQLLLGIDCATQFCVGYQYVMRPSDGYRAEDVVTALDNVWGLAGGSPLECVMEGGSWQAKRTLEYLKAAGVQVISAKGRPNQKLVEGFFNRLWTAMSISLPARGQVGRFRGEMAAENADWRRARDGVIDPRDCFPDLTEFLSCLDRAISYCNAERCESRHRAPWVPAEAYGNPKLHQLPAGLRERYALPVREVRTMRRGMVRVRTESPFGWPHDYMFAPDEGYRFDGAQVTVSFDPARIHEGAHISLAAAFHDMPAGKEIDAAAVCISAAPELVKDSRGVWAVSVNDGIADAIAAKRASRAAVGAQVAAFDGRGVRARKALHEGGEAIGIGTLARPTVPEPDAPAQDDYDFEQAERELGLYVSA